jgi:predicted deacetylase
LDRAIAVARAAPSEPQAAAMIAWRHGRQRAFAAETAALRDDRRPDLAEWLDERSRAGDAVAQHGFQHRRLQAGRGRRRGEFIGLDGDETRRAVLAGRRVLKLAGIQPRGFVAPGYAYTNALRETLATTFDWWAGIGRLHRASGAAPTTAPALALGTSSALKRWSSPRVVRAGDGL